MIESTTLSKKYLSCVISTKALSDSIKKVSNQRIVSTSKWFVGSSRINRFDSSIRDFTNSIFLRVPPENSPIFFVKSSRPNSCSMERIRSS